MTSIATNHLEDQWVKHPNVDRKVICPLCRVRACLMEKICPKELDLFNLFFFLYVFFHSSCYILNVLYIISFFIDMFLS